MRLGLSEGSQKASFLRTAWERIEEGAGHLLSDWRLRERVGVRGTDAHLESW